MQKTLAALAFGVVLAALSVPVGAGEPPRQENAVARVNVGPAGVDWSPAVDYERLVLTVVGPEGFENRQELEAGQSPSLSLFKPTGERLPDGIYRYELRVLPRVGGTGNLAAKTVQRGSLWIHDGAFFAPNPETSPVAAPASSKPPQIHNITGKDSVIPDDLVVQGTACIGPNCLNGDPDATNTIKLKSRTPRILFDDPMGFGCCFPATDWILQANTDAPSPEFFLQEAFSGFKPFVVQDGAPSYTLVASFGAGFSSTSGRVGINTQVPLQPLHVVSDTGPTIRLEQPVSPGPARIWDVGANNTQFFVSDITAGSVQPFRIRAGAPTSSIDVAASGNVGIGTASPSVPLHVSRSTGAILEGILLSNNNEARVSIENTGVGARYTMAVNNTNPAIFFIARNSDVGTILEVNRRLDAGGSPSLRVAGSVQATNVVFTSSRALKKDFQALDPQDVLTRVAKLPISEWSFKDGPDAIRHIGPMAEDFHAAFNLSPDQKTISVTDTSGVALAAIQALLQRVEDLEKKNAEMTERLKALEPSAPKPALVP